MAKEEHQIHDQTNILPKGRLIVEFSVLASALLIPYIDQNSIGVALTTIGRELNSSSTIVWAGTSSLIANTAFQVLYGRLSDILGPKVILITCLCLLALGDLLCGFARTGAQLYAFRGISGLANGGIMALVMMVVSDVTTLEQRGEYQRILGSCVGLGNTIGPFVAAALTENVTWRATFWLITPLALCVGVLLYFLLPPQTIPPEPLSAKLRKIDYAGGLLSSVGTILLVIPISGIGTQFESSDPMVIAMLTSGSAFLAMARENNKGRGLRTGLNNSKSSILAEWKFAGLPMFPLCLFNTPALAAMLTQNFLIGISARQMDLIASAALILPIVIPQAIASALSGQYISRMGKYGEVIWTGYICWVLGAALHCIFGRSTSAVAIAFILIVEGTGVGLVFQPIVISARNFIRALGGSAGLAIASAIFSNTLISNVNDSIPTQVSQHMIDNIFEMPDTLGLTSVAQIAVLDAYDKGLTRQEEKSEPGREKGQTAQDGNGNKADAGYETTLEKQVMQPGKGNV
ncbi:major facilitator superfamily domain-containing protein [Xylariomycetidae sp. FL2044]|nr:major facilitator superfamily domain-containing protein [Xylariomycetidae sp. FL2044]